MQIDDDSVNNIDDEPEPQIALDGAGNALAVWHQRDGTRSNIWGNRYTMGSGWGKATMIEREDSADVSMMPEIALDAAGNTLAVWVLVLVLVHDGGSTDIWASRFSQDL